MKKQLLVILFSCSLPASAQQPDTTQLITPFGKPDGKETSVKIGKEGGRLASGDGKVELIIPPGALSKKTTISIQPVANTLSGTKGKSYHLQPSGIEFKQPVQITFRYHDDNNGNDPLMRGIAMQDERGQWHNLSNITVDSISKTITGKINHFSYWVDYERVSITPVSGRVKVSKEIGLQLNIYIQPEAESDRPGQDALPPLPPMSLVQVRLPPVWTANGVVNGNAATGTIRTGDQFRITYRAPATVPARNPVAVTAELKNLNFTVGGRSFTSLKVTSNILVYDENTFEVKMDGWVDLTSLPCGSRSEDVGSFIVQVQHDRARVTDIQNSLLTIPIMSGCPCNQVWTNRAASVGAFHITGVQSIVATPANPPQRPYGHVRILFTPAQAIYPIFACPQNVSLTMPSFGALPVVIEFDTKKEEQVLYNTQEQTSGLKIVVRPLQDE